MHRYSKAVLTAEDQAILDELRFDTQHAYMVADYHDGREFLWQEGRRRDCRDQRDHRSWQVLMATHGLPDELRTKFVVWACHRETVRKACEILARAEEALA